MYIVSSTLNSEEIAVAQIGLLENNAVNVLIKTILGFSRFI